MEYNHREPASPSPDDSSRAAPLTALTDLWGQLGLPADALEYVSFTGSDPALPSSFRIGTCAQASIAAAGLAAAELHRARTGRRQTVRVSIDHACAEFRSERFVRVNGDTPASPWDKIAGAYRCKDDRWIRIHTNFDHHRDGILSLLKCSYDRSAVAGAFKDWTAEAFEAAASEIGMIAAMERSAEEWDAHPQGRATARLPLMSIEPLGDAPAEPLPAGARPLEGLRVLDLTRIIAGPVCGRTLAAHGATVLRVLGKDVPTIETVDIDNGRGKLSAYVDLKTAEGRRTLERLIGEADVFVQSYRPGALDALGFSAERVMALRPGIIYASLSAYAPGGPWEKRRGFDSIVQTASGFNRDEGIASGKNEPTALPAQALDHGAGHLLAFAAMAALLRRQEMGGGWHVGLSLSQVGLWLRRLGRVADGFSCADPAELRHVDRFIETTDSPYGRLTAVRHAAELSLTPALGERPSAPYGTHPAVWPARKW